MSQASNVSLKKWTDKEKILFIREYRQRECLWNTDNELYKSREARDVSYRELADMFDITVKEVKTKIKSLRSTYIQCKANMEAMKQKEGLVDFKPSLKWYYEMDALIQTLNNATKVNKPKQFKSEPVEEQPPEQDTADSFGQDFLEIQIFEGLDLVSKREKIEEHDIKLETIDGNESQNNGTIEENEENEPSEKKRKICVDPDPPLEMLDDSPIEHEFDLFGKVVAAQLKGFISLPTALRVQDRIMNLLTDERLAEMKRSEGNYHLKQDHSKYVNYYQNRM